MEETTLELERRIKKGLNAFLKEFPQHAGNCWHFKEMEENFRIENFSYGFAFGTRKSDGKYGSLNFGEFDGERIYFDFRVHK